MALLMPLVMVDAQSKDSVANIIVVSSLITMAQFK